MSVILSAARARFVNLRCNLLKSGIILDIFLEALGCHMAHSFHSRVTQVTMKLGSQYEVVVGELTRAVMR